jgi:transposase InsO family protein
VADALALWGRDLFEDQAPAWTDGVRGECLPGVQPKIHLRQFDSYDNALAESVIGFYKTEVIQRRGPWRNLESVEFATLDWVDWFNHRRLLESIGYVPPAEY